MHRNKEKRFQLYVTTPPFSSRYTLIMYKESFLLNLLTFAKFNSDSHRFKFASEY